MVIWGYWVTRACGSLSTQSGMKAASLNATAHRATCFFKHCSCNKPSFPASSVTTMEHGTDPPSQTLPAELVLELEKIKLHLCSAMLQKHSLLKLQSMPAHCNLVSMLWWPHQVSNCAEQEPNSRIHHSSQSWLEGFCTALHHYHRCALKHCLPIILKHSQYFEGLKDWHRTFSLSFPCHSCLPVKKNYAGLQVHDFLHSMRKALENWETMSNAIFLFTREKAVKIRQWY